MLPGKRCYHATTLKKKEKKKKEKTKKKKKRKNKNLASNDAKLVYKKDELTFPRLIPGKRCYHATALKKKFAKLVYKKD